MKHTSKKINPRTLSKWFAFSIIIIGLALMLYLSDRSQVGPDKDPTLPFHEGYDFIVLDAPIPDVSHNNITELFWYGCPHCLAVEPLVDNLNKTAQKEGWEFKQIHFPAKDGLWGFDFNVYAALHQMGLDDSVGKDYMREIQTYRLNRNSLDKFLESKKIDPVLFQKLMNNEVRDDLLDNAFRFVSEQVSGTPKFIIGGKYLMIYTPNDIKNNIELARYLIDKQP